MTGAIDYILSQQGQKSSTTCYFFCDFANRQSLEIRTILSSFIKQILTVFTKIPQDLQHQLEEDFGGLRAELTLDELFGLLVKVAQLSAITYFIIDGLDECSDHERRRLLLYLQKLTTARKDGIKVLISSREDGDISRDVQKYRKISLDSSQTSTDINTFVEAELHRRVEEGNLVVGHPSMILEIQEALKRGADGMHVSLLAKVTDSNLLLG